MDTHGHQEVPDLPEDGKTLPLSRHEDTDLEKQDIDQRESHSHDNRLFSLLAVKEGVVYESHPEKHAKWYRRLLDVGFEENGIKPVPVEKRTVTSYNNLFTVFFTGLLCLLPYVAPTPEPGKLTREPMTHKILNSVPTGILATLVFGMSLRDASLVILFFGLLTSIPPAFMGIGGMKTGPQAALCKRDTRLGASARYTLPGGANG